MAIQQVNRTDTFETWRLKTNQVANTLGDSVALQTTNKVAVQAINEVYNYSQGIQGSLQGVQSSLQGVQNAVQGIQNTIQGIQTTPGSQGTQGIQGIQGIQGRQGITGSQGTQGITGSGAQGTQGITGAQGTQGIQGITGPSTALNATANTTGSALYPVMVSSTGSNQTPYATTTSGYFVFNATNGALEISKLGVGTSTNAGNTGEIRATDNITAYYSSDERLKTNIVKIDDALAKVMQIDGVIYDWNDVYLKDHGDVDGYFVRSRNSGIIAQQVEKVFPNVVADRADGYKAVRYELLVPLLIEAIKDLKAEIDTLKAAK